MFMLYTKMAAVKWGVLQTMEDEWKLNLPHEMLIQPASFHGGSGGMALKTYIYAIKMTDGASTQHNYVVRISCLAIR